MKNETRRLISVAEAARMLGISRRTYDRWVEAEKVPPPIVIGDNDLRVVLAELEEWIENRQKARDRKRGTGEGAKARKGPKTGVTPPSP